MFETFLEDCVTGPESLLDEQLRANELEIRRLAAQRAALIGVIEQRGLFAAEHRTMTAYLRATLNCSTGTASRDRRLASLLTAFPQIGDALHAGHITIDAAHQIARIHTNPRIRELLGLVVAVLVDLAEHTSHHEYADHITSLIAQLDQDGAFDDLRDAIDGRRANVVEVAGTLVISAHGGDPIQAAQLQAIFDTFLEREYRTDLDTRRTLFGEAADQHPLPRTGPQRAFDALLAIFAAASGSPDAFKLPEPVVHLVVDHDTAHHALVHADIILPGGDHLDLDHDGDIAADAALLTDLAEELVDDPQAFLRRRCETRNGSPVHPSVIIRALLTGHVRRVVIDSRGVVIDFGTKQRLFTGHARDAAMLLHRYCEAPGCTMPAAWSQVDHNTEWHQGGPTNQRNGAIACGHDNRLKHRQRWKIRRDHRGRAYTLRPDGTIVLPVGERPPDLTEDELNEHIRQRLADLITTNRAASRLGLPVG